MSALVRLRAAWRNLVHRDRVERELDDELGAYLELLAAEKVRGGRDAASARREALLEVGGVQSVKLEVRRARAGAWLEAALQDVRYAVRGLRRTPGFSAVAVVTLALGIGANTSIFSLLRAVLLRPQPFGQPERLVRVYERRRAGNGGAEISGHEYIAWRDESRSFDGAALYTYGGFNLTGDGEPRAVTAMRVSANFFSVLDVPALLGRGFAAGEDEGTGSPVVVLSAALWRGRYGADSSVIGRQVLLDGAGYTVVGVVPRLGMFAPDLWVPMDVAAEARRVGRHSNYVVARLRRGATVSSANADLAAISRRLEARYPDANRGHGVEVVSNEVDAVAGARRPVLLALGAVAFVLLIACANVAHLLLQRAATRQRELAVRMALGASRKRLAGQLLAESLVVSVAGGAAGIGLALWVVRLLPALQAVNLPRLDEVRIDGYVLAVTAGLSVLTGVLSGVVPALAGTRLQLRQWMGEGVRTAGGAGGRLTGAFMISEVALALVLLVGAGLMLRSFMRLVRVDPGFDANHVLAVTVALPPSRYPTAARQASAYESLVQRIGSLPGVRAAAAGATIPLGRCCDNNPVTIEGQPAPSPGETPTVVLNVVTPGYFRTLGIALRGGRPLEASDARAAVPLIRYWEQQPYPAHFDESQPAPVAVIGEAMARRFWPGVDPIGKRFRVLFSPWITVVGVARDVRHVALNEPPPAEAYLAHSQEPRAAMSIVARTTGDPLALAGAIRAAIRAFDPDLPIIGLETMDQVVSDSIGRPRFNALLLGVFGAIALVLSLVGTYGVMAYGVAQRAHEIGIRSALGAQPRDVRRLVLGRAAALTLAGIVLGVAGALALTRLVAGLLYDVRPDDPATFAGVAVLLMSVSLLAGYIPARRALRVDPLEALRGE